MNLNLLKDALERTPVIAAITEASFEAAVASPAEVIFHLNANLLTVKTRVAEAHSKDKLLFVHLDLAEGLGKDKAGLEYLSKIGADGIISTRGQLIRTAKDLGLLTVQRFFALDTKGLGGILDFMQASKPDMIEIMPGIATKVILQFSGYSTPVIAGGLIETKAEVTEALSSGAYAISTGKKELWNI